MATLFPFPGNRDKPSSASGQGETLEYLFLLDLGSSCPSPSHLESLPFWVKEGIPWFPGKEPGTSPLTPFFPDCTSLKWLRKSGIPCFPKGEAGTTL